MGQQADTEAPGAGAPGRHQQSRLLWHPDGGIEGGVSLEAFVCCFHLSPSPLIYRLRPEETEEWESMLQEQLPQVPGRGSRSPELSPKSSPAQPWRSARNTAPEGASRRCAQPAPPATLEHASAEAGLEIFKLHHARLTASARIIMNRFCKHEWPGVRGAPSMATAMQGNRNFIQF